MSTTGRQMSKPFGTAPACSPRIAQRTGRASGSSRSMTGARRQSFFRWSTDMGEWIDFKALRAQLSFADVLRLYGVEVKAKANGKQHHGYCPLPNHNGKRNSPSFSANLEKG